MSTKQRRRFELIRNLESMGFSFYEAMKLRRIEMTLQRWGELCCGNSNDYQSWSIERDETTDKPRMVYHPHNGKSHSHVIADREKGALKRLAKIMAAHPDFVAYHQTDPRGCALYIVAKKELRSPVNQIVRCAEELGCKIEMHKTVSDTKPLSVTYTIQEAKEPFDCPESAAIRFLNLKGKPITSRDYPLDQVYNRGLAICD